jgi:hypothetical protein
MKTGQRFIVTTGEYSDYGIRDSFVVLRDFSFDKALARWIDKHGDDGMFSYEGGRDEQAFLASLRAEGLVADEMLNEIHLCDYSRPATDPAKDAGDEEGRFAIWCKSEAGEIEVWWSEPGTRGLAWYGSHEEALARAAELREGKTATAWTYEVKPVRVDGSGVRALQE